MEKTRCYGCMKLKSPGDICEHCGYDQRQGNAPHQLPTGTVLKEQYLLGRVLGQGGFGITYLGWDLYLDIPVAVKEYYPTGTVMRESAMTMDVVSCGDEAGVRFRNNKERFLREAKMLARFSQVPEIVQVRNFFLANNTAYIVMEYVEGITLKQYVRDHGGKLSMAEILSILGPVIQTLGKVHKAGLVHRDISPDNIMMLPDGTAKLLDFGAVRDVGATAVDKNLTKSTEAILKPGYAPIEQYLAHGNLGPWTDVYALCSTIFFCLTGQVPPASPERVLGDEDLNLEKEVPALSKEQRAALEHGLNVRAEARTASMEELYRELFAEHTPEPPKNRRWLYGLAAVLALCAVLFTMQALKGRETFPVLSTTAPSATPVPSTSAPTATPVPSTPPPTATPTPTATPRLISGKCGTGLNWTLDPDTGELIVSGKGKMTDYAPYDGVYAPWWKHKDKIRSVRMESGVTSVGAFAFKQCGNLTALELPDTLKEISNSAFDLCAITELTLPEGLKTIGESAFSWSPIKTLVIPDSVQYVGAYAFDCNGELVSVTIGPDTSLNYDTWLPIFSEGNPTIRGYTNSMAEDYARILGLDFESIGTKTWDAEGQCGDQAFWHLDLETGFLKIDGKGDMWDFNGTTEDDKSEWKKGRELPPWSKYRDRIYVISMAGAVTSIGEYAFKGCDHLADVSFGNSLKQIRFQAFLYTAVDQIVLPESVTDIEHYAFNWCESLTEVRLPEGLKRLEDDTIAECGNLRMLFVGKDTVIDKVDGLPFTLEEEGNATSYPDLTIVSLPGSDAERFAREYKIPFKTGVHGMIAEDEGQCGDDVYWFKCWDNLMLYGTGSTWLYGIDDRDRAEWTLRDYPESWLRYEHPGYYGYRDEIANVVILPGVTALGHNTITDFPNLDSIDFGTLEEANAAIHECPALEEVYLPDSMVEVGEWMLSNNPNLRRVHIENGSRCVLEGVFEWCYNLEEVWFSGKESIGDVNLLNQLGGDAPNPIFYVKHGSDAERYAKEHGIRYEYH